MTSGNPALSSLLDRPSCVCHGVPMRPRNDRIAHPWRCAVKANTAQTKQNPKRITLGRTYLGTENRFPAPREVVLAFARGLREEHLPWHA